jgi:hypothetical protein
MERAPLDLLVYALVFVGIVLVNYLLQRLVKRAQQQVPVPELPQEEGEGPPSPESLWGRAPQASAVPAMSAERVERSAAPGVSPAGTQRRTGASALFRSRADIRRAVVVMTVLGPCRAQEPPSIR